MANFNRILMTFWKQHKIKTYFDRKSSIFTFPCFYCGEPAYMNGQDAFWSCPSCDLDGNLEILFHLLDQKADSKKKIFNPAHAKSEINRTISKLSTRHPDIERELSVLKQKVDNLINFYI